MPSASSLTQTMQRSSSESVWRDRLKEATGTLRQWLKRRQYEEIPSLRDDQYKSMGMDDYLEEFNILLKFVYDRIGFLKLPDAPQPVDGVTKVRLKQADLINSNYQGEISRLQVVIRNLQEQLMALAEKNRILSLHEPEWSLERRDLIKKLDDVNWSLERKRPEINLPDPTSQSLDSTLSQAFQDLVPMEDGKESSGMIVRIRKFLEQKLNAIDLLEKDKKRLEREMSEIYDSLQAKEKQLLELERPEMQDGDRLIQAIELQGTEQREQRRASSKSVQPKDESASMVVQLQLEQKNRMLTRENQSLSWELGQMRIKHKMNLKKNQESVWKLLECHKRIENYERELEGPVKELQIRCDAAEAELLSLHSSASLVLSRCKSLLSWTHQQCDRFQNLDGDGSASETAAATEITDTNDFFGRLEGLLGGVFNRFTVTFMARDRLEAEKKMWMDHYRKLRQDHQTLFRGLGSRRKVAGGSSGGGAEDQKSARYQVVSQIEDDAAIMMKMAGLMMPRSAATVTSTSSGEKQESTNVWSPEDGKSKHLVKKEAGKRG